MPSPLPSSLLFAALNHLLADADWARARLRPFAGKVAILSLGSTALPLVVRCDGSLTAAGDEAPPAAVTLLLPAPSLALLAGGPEAWLSQAEIRGNAEFAENLGFVLRHLTWDAEGDLARVVGDITAHRLSRAGTRLFAALRRNAAHAADQARALAAPALLARAEFAPHREAVAALRQRLADLQARLKD